MTETAYGVFSSLLHLNQQHYCIHLGGCYSQISSFCFCFAVTLQVCLVLNVTGRISNVIQEALSDELLAVKLKTLNAHMCTNKWRLKEERCLYKRMGAVCFSCFYANTVGRAFISFTIIPNYCHQPRYSNAGKVFTFIFWTNSWTLTACLDAVSVLMHSICRWIGAL